MPTLDITGSRTSNPHRLMDYRLCQPNRNYARCGNDLVGSFSFSDILTASRVSCIEILVVTASLGGNKSSSVGISGSVPLLSCRHLFPWGRKTISEDIAEQLPAHLASLPRPPFLLLRELDTRPTKFCPLLDGHGLGFYRNVPSLIMTCKCDCHQQKSTSLRAPD